MASDGVKEGIRRLAKAIEVFAWLWLILFFSLGAVSAWGQQGPVHYDENFQRVPNTHPPINSPSITSAPPEKAAPASATSLIDPPIDPSKIQWDQPGKAALPSKSQMPGLPPYASDASTASGDDPFSRYIAQASEQEKAPAPPRPAKNYADAVLLALAGVVGFAILRTLAWILAGFAK